MVCTLKSVGIFFKYSPKRRWELEQCIVIAEEGRERSNDASLDLHSDTSTDNDNDSEDEEYEDGFGEGEIDVDDKEVAAEYDEDNPKMKAAKRKIKPMCETGCVECHTAFQDLEDLYGPLLLCLETTSLNKGRRKWDTKSKGVFFWDYSVYSNSGIEGTRILLGAIPIPEWTEYYSVHSAPDSRMDGIMIWRENCASAPEAVFKNGGFVYDRHERSWLVFKVWEKNPIAWSKEMTSALTELYKTHEHLLQKINKKRRVFGR